MQVVSGSDQHPMSWGIFWIFSQQVSGINPPLILQSKPQILILTKPKHVKFTFLGLFYYENIMHVYHYKFDEIFL